MSRPYSPTQPSHSSSMTTTPSGRVKGCSSALAWRGASELEHGDEDVAGGGGGERDVDLAFCPLRLKLRRCFTQESAMEERRDLKKEMIQPFDQSSKIQFHLASAKTESLRSAVDVTLSVLF